MSISEGRVPSIKYFSDSDLDKHLSNLYGTDFAPEYPKTINKRRYPPISGTERVVAKAGVFRRIEEDKPFFDSAEIKKIYPLKFNIELKEGAAIFANITTNRKAVILQLGAQGGAGGAVAMLAFDKHLAVDIVALLNESRAYSVWDHLKKRKIEKVEYLVDNKADRLRELKAIIKENGSVIVPVRKGSAEHFVVVDAVDDDEEGVDLRCSYHGWEIRVTQKAFMDVFNGGTVTHIVGPAH